MPLYDCLNSASVANTVVDARTSGGFTEWVRAPLSRPRCASWVSRRQVESALVSVMRSSRLMLAGVGQEGGGQAEQGQARRDAIDPHDAVRVRQLAKAGGGDATDAEHQAEHQARHHADAPRDG